MRVDFTILCDSLLKITNQWRKEAADGRVLTHVFPGVEERHALQIEGIVEAIRTHQEPGSRFPEMPDASDFDLVEEWPSYHQALRTWQAVCESIIEAGMNRGHETITKGHP